MADRAEELRKYQGIPRLPEGVKVDDETYDLFENLREQVENSPSGTPEHDDPLYGMRRLVDDVKAQLPSVNTEFGHVVSTTEFIDKRGRISLKETSDLGKVRVTPLVTREEADKLRATVELQISEREAIRDLLAQAKNRRSLSYDVSDSGSSDAAEQLRKEADDLQAQATKRMKALREAVPQNEWKSLDLGPPPEPTSEPLTEALKALQDHHPEVAVELWSEMSGRDRYILAQRADEKQFASMIDLAEQEAGMA
jgi:hypothetical protein